MADNEVGVTVSGTASGAVAAVSSVKQGIKDLHDQGRAHVEALTGTFGKLQEGMLAIGAIAAGGVMFKEMISSTIETIGAVTGLQKTFGMTIAEANLTKSSLDLLGLSTETYTQMAQRLDRQVRMGSDSLKTMGITARDLDLGQKGLMDKAIAKLAEYKEGVDRNIAAQVLFGRGGDAALKLIKLSIEGVTERARQLEEQFQLTVTPQDQANARQYKTVMNELGMAFEGIKKAIGDAVLPYLTAFANWFVNVAPTVISSMKTSMATVISTALNASESFVHFVTSAVTTLQNLTGGGFLRTLINEVDDVTVRVRNAAREISAFWALGNTSITDIDAIKQKWADWNKVVEQNEKDLAALSASKAEKFDDRFGIAEGTVKIEEFRLKALATIKAIRDAIASGKPFDLSNLDLGSPAKGTKSAAGLMDEGANKDAISAAMKRAQAEVALAKEALTQKATVLDLEVQLGQKTENQRYAQLQQFTEQAFQEELKILENQRSIAGQTLAQQQEVTNRIALLKARHNSEMINLDRQSIQAQLAMWKQYTDTISSGVNSGLRGILTGQTNFAQASKNVLLDLSLKTIELLVTKPVADYIAGKLAMLTADQSGAVAQTAAQVASIEAALPAKIASFTSDITARAALTYAGIFANLAPFLGPAAAAPAAAGEATVLAQLAAVPKFEVGAWRVPATGPAIVHKDEFIAPAGAPADAARAAMAGGGSGEGHTFNIYTMDTGTMASWLKGGGAALLAGHVSAYQDKNPSARPRR